MNPMLDIGPAVIQTSALLMILGFWLGIEISARVAPRYGVPRDFIDSTLWRALLAGVVAGRLVYVIYNLGAYINDPLGIVSPMVSTIDPVAFIIGAAAMISWRAWKSGVNVRPLLDVLAPGLGLVLISWALGDLMNGNKVGRPADLPWAVEIWALRRHPVQLYIAIPTLFVTLWSLRPGPRPAPGYDFLIVTGGYALSVLISSAYRESGQTTFEGLRQSQLVAFAMLVIVNLAGWLWASRDRAVVSPLLSSAAESPDPY